MQLNLLISDLLSFQEILNPDNAVFIVICICHYSNLIMVSNFFLQGQKFVKFLVDSLEYKKKRKKIFWDFLTFSLFTEGIFTIDIC